MENLSLQTPLVRSVAMTELLGVPVFLKLEAFQPSGSFKNRGIGYLCRYYQKEGKRLFVSSSGGNAGLAVAYSGRVLGVSVKVVIPRSTPVLMQERIRSEGAEVLIHGENWNEADSLARELSAGEDSAYIPPFDHPLIWEGHSSLIHEVEKANFKPGAVLLSVGGGGLYCGVVKGLKDLGWNDVPVITAETAGAASFYESIQAGQLVTLDRIQTIATSLGAKRVAEQAFQYSMEHPTIPYVVSDSQSLEACSRFLDEHRILVEPSCGATLSLVYQGTSILRKYSSILVVVCGGNAVTLSLLSKWLA